MLAIADTVALGTFAVFAASLLCTSGCGGEETQQAPAGPFRFDLVAERSRAELQREVREIRFGSRRAEPHLISGFGPDIEIAGEPAVLSRGRASSVEFFVAWPRDVSAMLDCRRLGGSSADEKVELWLNDRAIGSLRLDRARRQHPLTLPGEALRTGRNRLQFRYGTAFGFQPQGPADTQAELLFFALHLESPAASAQGAEAVQDTSGGELWAGSESALEIAFGSGLEYHLIAPADATLHLGAVRNATPHKGTLEVHVAGIAGRERVIASIEASDAGGTLQVPIAEGEPSRPDVPLPLRLSLIARPDGDSPTSGRLVIEGARVESSTGSPSRPAPNVVIYLVDTLRRDHLGVYGYPREVSPQLDAFAREALVFEDAAAQSSWTRPTVVSFFTGLNPRRHGVTDTTRALPQQAATLAELFRAAGYATAGFTSNPHMSREYGVAQGFRDYAEWRTQRRDAATIHSGHEGGQPPHPVQDWLHEAALDWLAQRDPSVPFLLFVHSMGPHAPYRPPDAFWQALAPDVARSDRVAYQSLEELDKSDISDATLDALRALYDAEVAASDDRFGVLLRALEAGHAYRDSIILFTSDHGEAFRERGRLGHGSHLHAETRDIPLLIKPAGESGRGRRVSGTVAQVDLLPTLLDLAGLPASAEHDGTSFATVVRGGDRVPDPERPVLAHLRFGDSPLRTSVSKGRWTLIHTIRRNQRGESLELFDRELDPQERADLADRHPEVVAELLELLERGDAQAPEWPVGQHDPDATMVEQLEALGYAQ